MKQKDYREKLMRIINKLGLDIYQTNGKEYTRKNILNNHTFYIEIVKFDFSAIKEYVKVYVKKKGIVIEGRCKNLYIPKRYIKLRNISIALLSITYKSESEFKKVVSKHYSLSNEFNKDLFLKNLKNDLDIDDWNVKIEDYNNDRIYITINDYLDKEREEYFKEYKEILKNITHKEIIIKFYKYI